jgi:hypothetical protein
MRQCIFCPNPANSQEHLWAEWLLKREPLHLQVPVRHTVGDQPARTINTPITIGWACTTCNNGWMSDLEREAKPILGPLISGVTLALNTNHQQRIAQWALKTAMIAECSAPKSYSRYYQKLECENLRIHGAVPTVTQIWLGQASGGSGKSIDIFRVWPFADDRTSEGCITTIIINRLVMQIASFRLSEISLGKSVTVRPGLWRQLLVGCYPTTPLIYWPPQLSFTDSNDDTYYKLLENRWKTGKQVSAESSLKKAD